MMDKWLMGHLCELQLLLCLLLLCLFPRPLATRALLLETLVLGAATTPLLPRRRRGGLLLLLLELWVLGCFALDRTELVGLLALLLSPFTSQGGNSPCCVDGYMDLVEGWGLQLSRGVLMLR